MTSFELGVLVKSVAKKYQFEPFIIQAFIQTESRGENWAFRYEPKYHWLVNPQTYALHLGISEDSEIMAQMTSWGLMQIMGGVARELGFCGYLPSLCDPDIGLDLSVKKLSLLRAKYPKLEDMAASYNAGSVVMNMDGSYADSDYVDKIKFWTNYFRDKET